MDYIQDDKASAWTGYGLVALVVLLRAGSAMIDAHLGQLKQRMGINASNGLISLIYEKTLKLSNATNKKYKKGDIINFISVDARKLVYLSE